MIFVCRRFYWLCRNLCLLKTSLIKEKKNCLWKTSLFVESFLDQRKKVMENFPVCGKFFWSSKIFCGNIPWLWKTSLCVENFLYQVKFLVQKISLTVKNFLVFRKFSLLWKHFLIKENFLDCGRISWSRKISLTVEKFLDQVKFFWLWKTYFVECRINNKSNNFEKHYNIRF